MKIQKLVVFGMLLFQSFSTLAQGEAIEYGYLSDVFKFSRIPLDTVWEYFPDGHIGFENLDAKATWIKANPVLLQNAKGKPLAWSGIGWFQQRFKVPDSLNGKLIALNMGHFGASEIYLDGKLVRCFGDVLATSGKGKSFLPRKPFTAMLNNERIHTFRVRYAAHKFDKVLQPKLFLGFCLTIAPLSESYISTSIVTYHGVFSMSLYLAFTLLFFFLFLFYPQRLASLFTALYLLNFSVLFSSMLIAGITTDASIYAWSNLLWKSSVSLVGGWSLLFIYSIYYRKMPLRSWLIVIVMIINISIILYPFIENFFLMFINILIGLETWRITILGIRDKRPGFWILGIGQFLGTLFFVFFIGNLFHLFPPLYSSFSIIREIGGFLSDLSAPLMFSLQLAWEFGSSNRSLKEQLDEIQKLSKENLEKEKEKQHILATHNEELENQVTERTTELQQSLFNLKAAQAQLIQSEKLASLGELTAGIAHEIQNPLNFVNNFSELSGELIDEMNEEIDNGNLEEVKAISGDLKQNLEKINHHGKRASSIVKGMLEHSRASTGVKELTDINALADEYLRLSYHGLRAKDKNGSTPRFNADFKTNFDQNLPKIKIIPQDFGRVLLNVINNAFYTVQQKNKLNLEGYKPLVNIETHLEEDEIVIKIQDNGSGMPDSVKAKIFQPFFTTKPTGEGTGLGLSLAYDIITKAHGGTLEVETKEGVGTTFIIKLPYI